MSLFIEYGGDAVDMTYTIKDTVSKECGNQDGFTPCSSIAREPLPFKFTSNDQETTMASSVLSDDTVTVSFQTRDRGDIGSHTLHGRATLGGTSYFTMTGF